MRLITKTNPAARVRMACAFSRGKTLRTSEIAQVSNARLNHLLQLVHGLHAHGLIETQRGRHGGLRLTRSPEQTSMGSVFRVSEAGHPFAECFDAETNTCPLSTDCHLRGDIARAVEAFNKVLDMVRLEDRTRGNCGLEVLLNVLETLADACPHPVVRA